ncbi:hypothetical protein [uncultured Jannaschia sp.]|uniref:hypothetical protein n=1 Tax=uncultured Jannaschia sp. TaxID=293347 RepID=UPI002612A3AE|nr:hypothetical protein [uncultured Jannaschia sp.]
MRGLLLLGLLVACAPAAPTATFRDPGVTIASKADFDPAGFAGRWYEIAHLSDAAPCPVLDVTVTAAGLLMEELCAEGRRSRGATLAGPGRLALSDGTALLILWIDADNRTAIVASPDGGIARILDRGTDVAEDRWQAALDVLEFNGFRTEALIGLPRQPVALDNIRSGSESMFDARFYHGL